MARITWGVKDAVKVTIFPNVGQVALSGTLEVLPQTDTRYTIVSEKTDGTAQVLTQTVPGLTTAPAPSPSPSPSPAPVALGSTPTSWTDTGVYGVNINKMVGYSTGGAFTGIALLAGAMPPGLALIILDNNQIVARGTPTAHGTFGAIYRVTGPTGAFDFAVNFTCYAIPLHFSANPTSTQMVRNQRIDVITSTVSTGGPITEWPVSPSGSLPPGIYTLNTGGALEIHGVPTAAGDYAYAAFAKNASGWGEAITLNIHVANPVTPVGSPVGFPVGNPVG